MVIKIKMHRKCNILYPIDLVVDNIPGIVFDFNSVYRKQDFSIPNSVVFYITKYPTNVKAYQKLIQTCKYFFNKNPIIVLRCLHYTKIISGYSPGFKHLWVTCFGKKCLEHNDMCIINRFGNKKLWITDKIDMIGCFVEGFEPVMDASYSLLLINLMPKLYRCDAQECYLYCQSLNFDQFLFFASTAKRCDLCSLTIKDTKNGREILLERIMDSLPFLEEIQFDVNDDKTNISPKTAEKLLKISHFSKVKICLIHNVPDTFDYQILKEYANIRKDVFFEFRHPKEFGIPEQKITIKFIDTSESVRLIMRSSEVLWFREQMKS